MTVIFQGFNQVYSMASPSRLRLQLTYFSHSHVEHAGDLVKGVPVTTAIEFLRERGFSVPLDSRDWVPMFEALGYTIRPANRLHPTGKYQPAVPCIIIIIGVLP